MSDTFGNSEKTVGNVTITCITPEARDLLDKIMAEWSEHEKKLRESFPNREPSIYGFAYWLVRHSGLIRPA